MKNLDQLIVRPRVILTDIDDTLTDHGQLHPEAYAALWTLKKFGFKIIPVTGRPAGWCEMIARFWPVDGIVGENGAFYFRYHNNKMLRFFETDLSQQMENKRKLLLIENEILSTIPGTAVASDQFCRMADLAIDFCEDVPRLPEAQVLQIKKVFERHGAQAKISSIHVNGWFGSYDKLTMIKKMLAQEFQIQGEALRNECLFSGDSPNDEPMFEFFPLSVGVANVRNFLQQMKHPPTYVTPSEGGKGFVELVERLVRI
jgi:HAD superfamily hydrolase (TIGR01484 family)